MMNEITVEEAVKIIKSLEFYDRPFDNTCEQSKTKIALLMAIKALEQKDVLKKIREEIEVLSNANPSYTHTCDVVDREDVLDIIDKYRKGDAE